MPWIIVTKNDDGNWNNGPYQMVDEPVSEEDVPPNTQLVEIEEVEASDYRHDCSELYRLESEIASWEAHFLMRAKEQEEQEKKGPTEEEIQEGIRMLRADLEKEAPFLAKIIQEGMKNEA